MSRRLTLYLGILALVPGATVAYITDSSQDSPAMLRPVVIERMGIPLSPARPFEPVAGIDRRHAWAVRGIPYASGYAGTGCGPGRPPVSLTTHAESPGRYVM